ncbi:hypothetical protein DM01DRAFT_345028 [Hesseltinella vesiculosa]|uniref:Uncharacterized protein n=1 Tax=Hesseltinella vesiculosa TaxID=101127 RepID=A0A1X2GFD6_9FUNG|nr:hypothetical protein DM01DRAFT_345028 [Hesseltinella vesiculosa]
MIWLIRTGQSDVMMHLDRSLVNIPIPRTQSSLCSCTASPTPPTDGNSDTSPIPPTDGNPAASTIPPTDGNPVASTTPPTVSPSPVPTSSSILLKRSLEAVEREIEIDRMRLKKKQKYAEYLRWSLHYFETNVLN